MAKRPKIIRMMRQTKRMPFSMVKSYLVWKANMVRARQTTVQMPTAISTCRGAARHTRARRVLVARETAWRLS